MVLDLLHEAGQRIVLTEGRPSWKRFVSHESLTHFCDYHFSCCILDIYFKFILIVLSVTQSHLSMEAHEEFNDVVVAQCPLIVNRRNWLSWLLRVHSRSPICALCTVLVGVVLVLRMRVI